VVSNILYFKKNEVIVFSSKFISNHSLFCMLISQQDGKCNSREGNGANIAECGFEAGDCINYNNFRKEHPNCWPPGYNPVAIGGELQYMINNLRNLWKA
jgi:hypothetical protein